MNNSVFSALFPLKLPVSFEECILCTPVQKDAVPLIFISNYHRRKPNSTTLDFFVYFSLKFCFETSFKSFQKNTEGRRRSIYSIKLIMCSHYRSRYKGLCQNKKHDFTNIQREVTFAPHIWP